MKNQKFSRRSFVSGTFKAGLAGLLAKIVPEASAFSEDSIVLGDDKEKQYAYSELSMERLKELMNRVYEQPEYIQIQKFLEREGFSNNAILSGVVAYDVEQPEKNGKLVFGDFSGRDANHYSRLACTLDSNQNIRMGISTVEVKGENKHLEVFEFESGDLVSTANIIVDRNGKAEFVTSNGTKTAASYNTNALPNQYPVLRSTCGTCLSVCETIYGLGCGFSGIFACGVACIPFAGPVCGIICSAVYLVLCVIGSLNVGCYSLCQDYNYC